tara:strand:+ start:3096 stop:3755 length:660 start_codon:yes stop_codon:yes gene_type:complete
MRNNYLYFGIDAAATMAFDNHTAQTLQLTTGGFDNPVPTGTNFIANGGLKVTVTYNANHTYGSYYTAAMLTGEVEIHPNALTYDGTDTITIATAAADPVYGWTKSSTGSENDLDVTQLKPYVEGNGYVYNSKYLKGIAVAGATTTALNFQAKTGDANAIDIMTVTHGSAKFKEFSQGLTDIIADDNKVSGMVVIVDDMRGLVMPQDTSSIASVAATLDT